MFHPNRVQHNVRASGSLIHPRFQKKLKFYLPFRGDTSVGGTGSIHLDYGPTHYKFNGNPSSLGQIAFDASGGFFFNIGDPVVADFLALTGTGSDYVAGAYTLMGWMKGYVSSAGSVLGNTGQKMQLVLKASGGTNVNASMFVYTDNNVYLQHTVGGAYSQCKTSGGKHPPTGAWHHFAGVYDGAIMRIYVDGIQEATLAASGTPDQGGTTVWYVGRDNLFGGCGGTGLRDVAVWDRALTGDDVVFAFRNRDLMMPQTHLAYIGSSFPAPPPAPGPGGPYIKTRHGGTSHGAIARAVSATFTVNYDDFLIEADSTANDLDGYLFPWDSIWQGREIIIKNVGTHNVRVHTYDAASIDGVTTSTITTGASKRFIGGVTQWIAI